MLLRRDLLVTAIAIAIAATLYVASFRDLMAVAMESAAVGVGPFYIGHL